MRIVYAGTPEFAVPALAALLSPAMASRHSVVAVYTQPDRPAGRGRAMTASPVKQCAQAAHLPIEQPLNFREEATRAQLAQYQPDVMVVAAYGLILPQPVLDIPRYGCINIHGSLLPRWRGAAPIQRAIEAGDAETGITIMRMEAGLDTGPMLLRAATPIGAQDTAADLHDRLAALGAQLLVQTLDDLPRYLQSAEVQPSAGVTYAKKLSKEAARLDWSLSAETLDRQIRAFNPWPIAETVFNGTQLRIWRADPIALTHHAIPGTVLEVNSHGIHVACGAQGLRLLNVQLAGRKIVSAQDFSKAHELVGVRLGTTLEHHS